MPSATIMQTKDKHQEIDKTEATIQYVQQAERLGQYFLSQQSASTGPTHAVEAKFITSQEPIIETANGGRLPAVPLEEGVKLNVLKDIVEGRDPTDRKPADNTREALDGSTIHGAKPLDRSYSKKSSGPDAPLREANPQWRTDPLFPPIPIFGPPTLIRDLQCMSFRVSSAILSFLFLLVIMLGSLFTSIPIGCKRWWMWMTLRNPDKRRPFYEEEIRRASIREKAREEWETKRSEQRVHEAQSSQKQQVNGSTYTPTEGGADPLVCDVAYYARRVGLDAETLNVETEDGFIIELWHLFNPLERRRASMQDRDPRGPNIFPENQAHFDEDGNLMSSKEPRASDKRYPVLMIHGLLQSSGAYCSNDDESLAFYLAKSGYDVWLGNNRCGFEPKHVLLKYADPRMWAWNIRQMGVMDLPALISRVLTETGFPKCALIAHSQGTTQTLVALAKEQRPEIGSRISVFCALAPAAYAGPLIGKAYFKFMRVITPSMFRVIFGIHSFIPLMMAAHKILPGKFYGYMGYKIFSFLFNWSDERWDRGLRDRMFQFAPVYVSAESMRWWLGRECFAKQKCILATREEGNIEDEEDAQDDEQMHEYYDKVHGRAHTHPSEDAPIADSSDSEDERRPARRNDSAAVAQRAESRPRKSLEDRRKYAWYGPHAPPMAMWICGNDELVDGRRLLRRFERGREPYVQMVHAKIIEGYEHLDVLWSMDSIQKVGSEVKDVIWQTVPEGEGGRAWCRTPAGCDDVAPFKSKSTEKLDVVVDATAGEWSGSPNRRRYDKKETHPHRTG